MSVGVTRVTRHPGGSHVDLDVLTPFASPWSPEIPFFQYTARLGRQILTARIREQSVAAEHWHHQGLSESFLTHFLAEDVAVSQDEEGLGFCVVGGAQGDSYGGVAGSRR